MIAHPVIASAIETLLRLEGDYELRRVASVAEATKAREWGPNVALVDGTLLSGYTRIEIGAPAYVLSGSERDGRQLARRLDDGRGWLRKDATGPELARAIDSLLRPQDVSARLGTIGVVVVGVLSVIVLALVVYLLWLALY